MAEITAAAVKELREKSGAGMMDCKKALSETNGDMEAAADWLRAKGLAAAAKKSSRTAAEGLVGLAVAGTKGVAIEVNSQTDFVAKNEIFQNFVREATSLALETGDDIAALKAAKMASGQTVDETLTANIATIGENQVLRRAKKVEVAKGAVIPYVHNAAAPGLGKIGVLVALESMVDGAVKKFAKENALLSQLFVMDGKTPVSDVIAKAAKDSGSAIVLKDYVRFQLGEGIEKEESDFAAEVAATAGLTK